MEALILCGGFATRLEPITLFIPKPLLPVGGKPVIEYIVSDISSLGIKKITISTNKKFADQFEYWMRKWEGNSQGVEIGMVVEPTLHDGHKFGAIKGIEYAIEQKGIDDDLLIVAGDNFYTFSLGRLIEKFRNVCKPTICAYDVGSLEGAKRFGVIRTEGEKVLEFQEKPDSPKSTLVSTGIYAFPKKMLGRFRQYLEGSNNPDAPGYFLQWLISDTELHAVVYNENWFDIGTIDMYKRVFAMFHKEQIE